MPATKSTFSLDLESLERLNRLSRLWQVSKTEALRRALTRAEQSAAPSAEERIAALHRLQRKLKAKRVDFEAWKKTIRDGRR
jgi:DNA repair photolyase